MKNIILQTLKSEDFQAALQQLVCEHMLLNEKTCNDTLTDQINEKSSEIADRMVDNILDTIEDVE